MGAAWVLAMGWRDVAFLHYRADAAVVAAALPPEVELDRHAGGAWLSIVPFRLVDVRLRGLPPFPGFRNVAELNLRTYVRVGGRPGVWFFNLDAANALVALSARTMTALPYMAARMRVGRDGDEISYASARTRDGGDVLFRARYRATAPLPPAREGSLERFLHDRGCFFTDRAGGLIIGEIEHAAWPLQGLDVDVERETLGDQIGHPLPRVPALATFARGVAVRTTAVRRAPGT